MTKFSTVEIIIEEIKSWRTPNQSETLEYIQWIQERNESKTNTQTKEKCFWAVNEKINPLQMYLYLKARFGDPNGLAMEVIEKDTSDNLLHWEYLIVVNDTMVTFTGFTFHFNILIHKIDSKNSNDKQNLLSAIARDFGSHRKKMDEIFKTFESWILFINPFYHYSDMIEELFDKLKETKLAKPSAYSRPKNAEGFKALEALNKNLHQAFSIGTMLKLIIPIWIESYVNLILVLLAKDSIKKDKNNFEMIKRQSIIKKIKNLHNYCHGITDPVSELEIKEIRAIFKTRNKYLHGSFEPKFDPSTNIFFDRRYTPLFNTTTYSPYLIRKLLLNEINEDLLDKEIYASEKFILLLFSKIDTVHADSLVRITNESIIGWDQKRLILGCVLPNQFPDLFFENENKT